MNFKKYFEKDLEKNYFDEIMESKKIWVGNFEGVLGKIPKNLFYPIFSF